MGDNGPWHSYGYAKRLSILYSIICYFTIYVTAIYLYILRERFLEAAWSDQCIRQRRAVGALSTGFHAEGVHRGALGSGVHAEGMTHVCAR